MKDSGRIIQGKILSKLDELIAKMEQRNEAELDMLALFFDITMVALFVQALAVKKHALSRRRRESRIKLVALSVYSGLRKAARSKKEFKMLVSRFASEFNKLQRQLESKSCE